MGTIVRALSKTLTQRLTKMLTSDGQTDRRTTSFHRPELVCNPAKNVASFKIKKLLKTA